MPKLGSRSGVLKRFSFIGDGLSHVAFMIMAIAGVLNLTNDMIIVLPGTILCAILLLGTGGNSAKIKGDASLAMISVGSLAFGYLLVSMFSKSSNLSEWQELQNIGDSVTYYSQPAFVFHCKKTNKYYYIGDRWGNSSAEYFTSTYVVFEISFDNVVSL